MAVGLTDRKRGLAQWTEDRVKDDKVLALARKVDISLHPDLARLDEIHDLAACDLTVTMKDGRKLSKFARLTPVGGRAGPQRSLGRCASIPTGLGQR